MPGDKTNVQQKRARCQGLIDNELLKSWQANQFGKVRKLTFECDNPFIDEYVFRTLSRFYRINKTKEGKFFIVKSRLKEFDYNLNIRYQVLADAFIEYELITEHFTKSTTQLYLIIKMMVQNNPGIDTVRLNNTELNELVPNYTLDRNAFYRAIKQLKEFNIIKKVDETDPERKYDYYYNFLIFFCGNRSEYMNRFETSAEYRNKKLFDDNKPSWRTDTYEAKENLGE